MTRRELLAAFAASPLLASQVWDDPAFPDWSRAHIDKVLTDSPWAHQKTIPFVHQPREREPEKEFSFSQIGLPGGIGFPRRGGGTSIPGGTWPGGAGRGGSGRGGSQTSSGIHTEAYLTVRWSSALPVRQALVLTEFGKGGFQDPKAKELLERAPSQYVVDVSGFPAILFSRNIKALEADLAKNTRIYLKGRKPLAPLSVEVPEQGMHLSATLQFPRWKDVSDDEGTVEFTSRAGTMKIEIPFKLKPMVYQRHLEM